MTEHQAPVITLLTDFGLEDEYVGVMKGVVLSINPGVQIVDITHYISRHGVMEAALVIKTSFRYFPRGSVHVIVVDPGVGGRRKVVCLKKAGHFFVAPDNGVLSLLLQEGKVDDVRHITNDAFFLKPVSNTFHGRDIFAPVAARLSKGAEPASLGEEIKPSSLAVVSMPAPSASADAGLVGEVISIDRFGNLMTNIDQEILNRFLGAAKPQDVVISLGEFRIQGLSSSYDAVAAGMPLAVLGSRSLLEVSVNQQSAQAYFGASVGQRVRLQTIPHKA
jgi:hypothetical protein